jgi:two-component system, chemotaxis family, protein-glutamate methylesterase/glutaminase
MSPVRVLLVDDSNTVRAVLRRLLSRSGDFEIVGEAADGARGVELANSLRPDIILMDVEMPVMDGFAATARIMAECPTPIIVITSRGNRKEMRTAFEALRHGAMEMLPKPESTAGWEEMAASLPGVLKASARGMPRPPKLRSIAAPPKPSPQALRFVALGASTGGPAALRTFLEHLPARGPVALLIVQHIAAGFEGGLADWLGQVRGWDVRVAREGDVAIPGTVRIAPTGVHLQLLPGGILRLDGSRPAVRGHRPSADVLFQSCAANHPLESAGVLLSGMGTDGADGLSALKAAGGLTLVQDAASCVVFGMPKTALERGAASIALSPERLARTIASVWKDAP